MSKDLSLSFEPRDMLVFFFFFNDTATTEIYTLSLHDALPISQGADAALRRALPLVHHPGADAHAHGYLLVAHPVPEVPMTWGNLRGLYLLIIVPILVIAFALDGQRRRRLLEHIGHLPMIARMTASFSPGRRRWRAVLQVAGIALLIVALARP